MKAMLDIQHGTTCVKPLPEPSATAVRISTRISSSEMRWRYAGEINPVARSGLQSSAEKVPPSLLDLAKRLLRASRV